MIRSIYSMSKLQMFFYCVAVAVVVALIYSPEMGTRPKMTIHKNVWNTLPVYTAMLTDLLICIMIIAAEIPVCKCLIPFTRK